MENNSPTTVNDFYDDPFGVRHDHVFLGTGHDKNERKLGLQLRSVV